MVDSELMLKYENLKIEIKKLGKSLIAFSGGIDSALLLKVAHDILGKEVIAVTADSPSIPRSELEDAGIIAREIGAAHIMIKTNEAENPEYLKNPANRCYFCKTELYSRLRELSAEMGFINILNGTNLDDLGDYRPGMMAAHEKGIMSPLKDAGFTKKDVRELARHLGLKAWDKPSSPCMSSRIPYGSEITLKKLSMIEEAENYLKDMGIRELRVRHLGNCARIEVNEFEKKLIEDRLFFIKQRFSEIGFSDISVANFRSGSLNLKIMGE